MKVILLEDVENLGKAGETVTVKAGYARNFLIPKKKGLEATPQNLKMIEMKKAQMARKEGRGLRDAEKIAERLETLSVSISRQAGDHEKLFGSVTSIDIQKALKEQGIELERKMILLEEPIKALGAYIVPVKLHKEVKANLKVWVVKA